MLVGCANISGAASDYGYSSNTSMAENHEAERITREFGPLEDFIGRIVGAPEFESGSERQAEVERAHLEAEELIAACMLAQGFDYLINPSSGITVTDINEIEFSVPFNSRAWAEVYGFGIAHPDLNRGLPPVDQEHHAISLLETMTPAEVDAWFYALYGPPEVYWEWGGCFGEAQATLWWNYEPIVTGFEFFADEVWRYWAWIWSGESPLFSELDSEWRNCMAATGLDLLGANNPRQLNSSLFQEWNQTYISIRNGWGASPNAETDRKTREIALAVAHWDCNREIDYDSRHRAIELRLEQEFVDRHRGELEYWAILNEEAQAARRESTVDN